ncbi:hypothetical protein GCM10009557_41470 [Virgisporangium ochraceum]|uniref:Uncharacterized protein n=1 Tax=Virgisporangium ochraceum TaxID=65505 RepID=A0A8J3ZVD7_9ACTN|nr:hypothetical protein [Virgisporangium ochraceum]GIJ68843.1 hypothetical protein Voc01_037600 [Virgisporangium ochraceum]
MRTRHPAGCACDQPWHHQQPAGQASSARRSERDRMNAARQVGKVFGNLARERRADDEAAVHARAAPP